MRWCPGVFTSIPVDETPIEIDHLRRDLETCDGNGRDHCYWHHPDVTGGDRIDCQWIEKDTVPGRQWSCGLLRQLGTWEKVYLESPIVTLLVEEFGANCGDWPQNIPKIVCNQLGRGNTPMSCPGGCVFDVETFLTNPAPFRRRVDA